jgi:hypothetical protein
MKIKLIAFLTAFVLILIPIGTVGAATTADVTVNATPQYVSISVAPATYAFGSVATSTNYSTSTGYFTITNGSSVQTDQTIAVVNATWLGGVAWTHSDTGTAGADTVALYASKNTGAFDIIVKNAAPNYIAENQAASTNYQYELRMCTPTSFSDGVIKSNVVRVTAAVG